MNRTITIGRSSSCDIVVPYEGISREHAEISLVGGQYVYTDKSKNGSVLNGQIIANQRIAIAPGAPILLAGKIPLPWAQVYALLPMKHASNGGAYESETVYEGGNLQQDFSDYRPSVNTSDDSLGIGWGILAFLFPIAGWIMYFVWKDSTPNRARSAAVCAWISVGLTILIRIFS